MKQIFPEKSYCRFQENIISLGMQINLFSLSIFWLRRMDETSDELVWKPLDGDPWARKDGSLPEITKGPSEPHLNGFPSPADQSLILMERPAGQPWSSQRTHADIYHSTSVKPRIHFPSNPVRVHAWRLPSKQNPRSQSPNAFEAVLGKRKDLQKN